MFSGGEWCRSVWEVTWYANWINYPCYLYVQFISEPIYQWVVWRRFYANEPSSTWCVCMCKTFFTLARTTTGWAKYIFPTKHPKPTLHIPYPQGLSGTYPNGRSTPLTEWERTKYPGLNGSPKLSERERILLFGVNPNAIYADSSNMFS